jgi:hypothetical protein
MELVLQLIIVVTVEIKHKFSENSVQVESYREQATLAMS